MQQIGDLIRQPAKEEDENDGGDEPGRLVVLLFTLGVAICFNQLNDFWEIIGSFQVNQKLTLSSWFLAGFFEASFAEKKEYGSVAVGDDYQRQNVGESKAGDKLDIEPKFAIFFWKLPRAVRLRRV